MMIHNNSGSHFHGKATRKKSLPNKLIRQVSRDMNDDVRHINIFQRLFLDEKIRFEMVIMYAFLLESSASGTENGIFDMFWALKSAWNRIWWICMMWIIHFLPEHSVDIRFVPTKWNSPVELFLGWHLIIIKSVSHTSKCPHSCVAQPKYKLNLKSDIELGILWIMNPKLPSESMW